MLFRVIIISLCTVCFSVLCMINLNHLLWLQAYINVFFSLENLHAARLKQLTGFISGKITLRLRPQVSAYF